MRLSRTARLVVMVSVVGLYRGRRKFESCIVHPVAAIVSSHDERQRRYITCGPAAPVAVVAPDRVTGNQALVAQLEEQRTRNA